MSAHFPKTLLVDDDPTWLMYVQLLTHDRLIVCQNPAQAIGLIRENNVQLLITDTNMPVVSGIDLLKKARAEFPYLPVIVLFSGLNGTSMTKEEVLKAGATVVMTKEEFITHLDMLIPKPD